MELFVEQGYDTTTTVQVADRAGVSEMTLFRHFATKEALVLEDPYDPVIADAIRARPAAEPPMRATVEGLGAAWRQLSPDQVHVLRTRLRILAEATTARGLHHGTDQTRTAIVTALAERGAPAAEARVVAAAVLAGLSTALIDWSRTEENLIETVAAALRALGGDHRA